MRPPFKIILSTLFLNYLKPPVIEKGHSVWLRRLVCVVDGESSGITCSVFEWGRGSKLCNVVI